MLVGEQQQQQQQQHTHTHTHTQTHTLHMYNQVICILPEHFSGNTSIAN